MNKRTKLIKQIEEIIQKEVGGDSAMEAGQIVEASRAGDTMDEERAIDMARQRASGVPLANLTGKTTFMGMELDIEPGVLVARAETELLAKTAVEILGLIRHKRKDDRLRVIDMGCGSGNLSCAIAKMVPGVFVYASDLSEKCTTLTARNVGRHRLESQVSVTRGDLLEPLTGRNLEGSIDMVVSNPPYISSTRLKGDRAFLLSHEPIEAFDGGPFGITIQQRLIKEAVGFLKPGGYLLFEFGVGQHRQVKGLFDRTGLYENVTFAADEAGEERVAIGVTKL